MSICSFQLNLKKINEASYSAKAQSRLVGKLCQARARHELDFESSGSALAPNFWARSFPNATYLLLAPAMAHLLCLDQVRHFHMFPGVRAVR